MTHGNGASWAVVQPHDGWTLNMVTLLDETLVKAKVKCASFSPETMFVVFILESQIRFVLDEVCAAACRVTDRLAARMTLAIAKIKGRFIFIMLVKAGQLLI